MTTTIICEIGSSPAPAWDFPAWCDAAQQAGATAIKAQMFRADHFPEAERESKYPLEFPRHRLGDFVDFAHYCGLQAGVSVFDNDAACQSARDCDFVKLAAREQFNTELSACAYAVSKTHGIPLYRSVSDLMRVIWDLPTITHLYTVQTYPLTMHAAFLAVLRAALWFRQHGAAWGWSSHTRGTADVLLAVALGATVIEKHLRLSPTDSEAGHSLTVAQFARMSSVIRKIERN